MTNKKLTPEELMKLTIEESLKSVPEHADKTDPLVGAIITTKDGEILASAHRGELRIGEHCEFTLIERKLKNLNLRECVLYVTLEPCIDEARKKPKRGCTAHICKARISTVYVGIRDPDPKVENKGVELLARNGIKVVDFPAHLETEIRKSNAQFIKEKELERMQLKKEEIIEIKTYLQETVSSMEINRFDKDYVRKFLEMSGASFSYPSEDFNQWALDFELVSKDNKGYLHPNRLGLILFGKKADEIYSHTIFKVEINYGDGETEIRDFGGPIVSQLTPILDYIKDKALKLTIDRSKRQREEKSDFPIDVLREAIANAIIHRDYENEKSTNYLSISPDKIIVRSPGNLESPLTIKDLETFDAPSISRNPKIMFVFNKMGLAEQRGIGLKNMGKLSPKPLFDLKAGMLQVTFSRTKDFIAESKGVDSNSLSQEDKDGLLFIEENGVITVNDYAKEFNIPAKTAQRRLVNLIEKGIVERSGERRWAKYKVTEKNA